MYFVSQAPWISAFVSFFIVIVFKDQNTPTPFVETFPADDGEAANAALPDHIYMDAMGFGMGNCCLQVKLSMQYIRIQLWKN